MAGRQLLPLTFSLVHVKSLLLNFKENEDFFNIVLFLLSHSQTEFYTDLTDTFLETWDYFQKPAILILKLLRVVNSWKQIL